MRAAAWAGRDGGEGKGLLSPKPRRGRSFFRRGKIITEGLSIPRKIKIQIPAMGFFFGFFTFLPFPIPVLLLQKSQPRLCAGDGIAALAPGALLEEGGGANPLLNELKKSGWGIWQQARGLLPV